MKELIKLDFFIQKKYIKSLIISFAFIMVMFGVNGGVDRIYTLGAFLVFYLMIVPIELEKRNKFNICLNSLPGKKSSYVFAKYICNITYIILINITLILISMLLIKVFRLESSITLGVIFSSLALQLVYIAVTQPLYIFISHKYYRIANILLIVLAMTFVTMTFNSLGNTNMSFLFQENVAIYGLIFGGIVYIVSLLVSLLIYEKIEVK